MLEENNDTQFILHQPVSFHRPIYTPSITVRSGQPAHHTASTQNRFERIQIILLHYEVLIGSAATEAKESAAQQEQLLKNLSQPVSVQYLQRNISQV